MSASAREKFIHALDDLILRARVVEPERIEIIGLLVDAYGEVGGEERFEGYRAGIEAAAATLLETMVDAEEDGCPDEAWRVGQALGSVRALTAPAAPKAPERGACERCGGTGNSNYDVGTIGIAECAKCGGTYTVGGADGIQRTFVREPNREAGRCEACNGTGNVNRAWPNGGYIGICSDCHGTGTQPARGE